MSEYYNVTTNAGDAAIATAIANNNKLNITHVAFGDGNGSVPTPNKTRSALVHEVHRQAVTKYSKHPTVANYIVIETIIPSSVGGFWIREMGIIADNVLISHGSHAPFYKVADPEGVSEYRLKFTQDVRDGSVVEIVLDESLIYASQEWVNNNYIRRNEIIDNLTTDDAVKPLSAKQGKKLQDEKFAKSGGDISGSVRQSAEDVHFTFGRDDDIGFVKSVGNKARLAIGSKTQFEIVKSDKYKVSYSDSFSTLMTLSGSGVLSTTGGFSGNASSASKLQQQRKIFGQDFDGTIDVAGNITTTTVIVSSDSDHYIDLGRAGVDRMNFAVYSGIFNFINAQNGNVIARLNSNGIDCNAATASKLQTARTVSYSGAATGSFNFDGSANASCVLTLANSGVAAGTYASTIQIPQISVNAAGQITAISQQNIRSASVNQSGVVQLVDDLATNDASKALTAKQGKVLQDTKFDKKGGAVTGSVQLTSDNSVFTVGNNKDIGFVKKQGAEGYLAVAKNSNFRVVKSDKIEISSDASDTFTTLMSVSNSGVLSSPGGYSGNADTASKLQTTRTIGGVNFDGTSNIDLPGVNTGGNQNTTGSAAKLTTARAINNVNFDGTQAITITAEQRFNGSIVNETQLNAAITAGVYLCSSENGLAGLYGYGFLQVYKAGDTISQVYFPHQLSGNNENIVALRQTWNGGSSWLGWYYLGQKDSSKLPLAGGVLTGPLTSNSSIKTTNNVEAMDVKASGWMYAGTYTGANGNDASFRGNASSASKLQNTRNIALSGAVSGNANFDGSGNITINTTANNAIGVGQSWSDVTSSRAANTTYTNTTGRPIQIIVTSPDWNNAGSWEFVVDSVSIANVSNADGYNQSKSVGVIVQNGSSYRVNGNFKKWSELR